MNHPKTTRLDRRRNVRKAIRTNTLSVRCGYTLLELTISSAAATVVLMGLVSTLAISHQAWNPSLQSNQKLQSSEVVEQIITDARFALSFSERTSNALTFTVPDRDADGQPETIRYAWSGTAGDPLTVEYNGQPAQTLLTDVESLNLSYLTRSVSGT
jgi:hypothetical protein